MWDAARDPPTTRTRGAAATRSPLLLLLLLAAAAAASAAAGAAPSTVAVTALDGQTTIVVSASTGDLVEASDAVPGRVPLAFDPGSGSFVGYAAVSSPAPSPPLRVNPNVVVQACNASDPTQRFSLSSNGTDGSVRVLTDGGALCLDVWNCGTSNGTVVDLYPCDSSGTCGDPVRTLNELFVLEPSESESLSGTGGELWSLLGPPRALCVEATAAAAGSAVALWACSGSDSQLWTYSAATQLLASVGSAGMCLAAPPGPPPPPPPPPPCTWMGAADVSGGGAAPIDVSRNASCMGGAATVLVTDTYTAAASSVVWTMTYAVLAATGDALPAFTVPMGVSLRPTMAPGGAGRCGAGESGEGAGGAGAGGEAEGGAGAGGAVLSPGAASLCGPSGLAGASSDAQQQQQPSSLSLWTTWTRGCVDNGADAAPGMCFGTGAWREPFSPLQLPASPPMLLRLGNRDFGPALAAFGAGVDDSITMPLVTLLRAADDFGLTLLLSPEQEGEPLLEVLLRVDGARVDLARLLRRLALGAPAAVTMTAHLRAHAADWRPALQLLLDVHPSLVLPHAPNSADFAGLGGYSWQAPLNASYARSVGFHTNWELSGTFMPYDGLFAPYADEWLNLGPINAGLPQYNVTYASIAAFDEAVQAAGLNSLSYFDVGNFGVSIDTTKSWPNVTCGERPSGAGPAPCPTPEGSNAYLQHFLSAALLDDAWSVARGFVHGAIGDWVGTTLMDPSEPFFEDLLIEQLGRRMGSGGGAPVSAAQGIAVDRFDYSAYYSFKRDDGVSWVPQPSGGWGPAQSLLASHMHVYARMAALLRGAAAASPPGPKVMYGNCNTLCRIDLAASFDGGFSEGAALNAVAFLGLRRPAILWTYSLDGHSAADLDLFFQQHVLMRVWPMAPMPGNDHSITPGGDPGIQAAYEAYAPAFEALRGAEWVLDAARPVAVAEAGGQGGTALANLFRLAGTSDGPPVVQGELLAVVVFAGGETVNVTVSGATLFKEGLVEVDAYALGPVEGAAWAGLGRLPVGRGGMVSVGDIVLTRGCVLVRLVPVGG
jgi:hypothetical protein